MGGASVRAFSLFEKICGNAAMRNSVIVTNMWSHPLDRDEVAREAQLKTEFFRTALDNGAQIARRGGIGPESALAIIQLFLNFPPVQLQIQRELAVLQLSLDETQAGALVDQNLKVRLQRQERERIELEEELQAAYEDRDKRAQEQLERFRRDKEEEVRLLMGQLEILRTARERMAVAHRLGPPDLTQPPPPSQPSPSASKSGKQGLWVWKRVQKESHRR